MNDSNDLLRVCSLSSHYTLMSISSLFDYFKNYDLCQFEFTSGQYFFFRNDVLDCFIFIDLKHDLTFWTRSIIDICDVLNLLGYASLFSIHPELPINSVSSLILDPDELIDGSMSLVDITYSNDCTTRKINKFIKEFGYEPIVWEVKE